MDAEARLRSNCAEMYEGGWKIVKNIESIDEVHAAQLKSLPVGVDKSMYILYFSCTQQHSCHILVRDINILYIIY